MSDQINHPSHYNYGSIEPIDVIEDWSLGYHLGNALKYIARAGHKGDKLEDLQKAHWYINREIQKAQDVAQDSGKVVDSDSRTIDCVGCGRRFECQYAGSYTCKCGQKYWVNKV